MRSGFGFDPIPGEASTPAAESSASESSELTPATAALRVVDGPGAGRTFRIPAARGVIGRSDPPAIRVDLDLTECERDAIPVVSRRHAEWEWVLGTLQIVDLGSTNGTWVNGVRLAPDPPGRASTPQMLGVGDRIVLGNLTLVVCPTIGGTVEFIDQ